MTSKRRIALAIVGMLAIVVAGFVLLRGGGASPPPTERSAARDAAADTTDGRAPALQRTDGTGASPTAGSNDQNPAAIESSAGPSVAAGPATRLSGRVVTAADGVDRPIPDAIVRLITADGETLLETAPEPTGGFRIEVADPPPTGFGIRVSAPGYLAFDQRGLFTAGADHDLGRIELFRGNRVSGRVLDEAGRPLHAEVALLGDEDDRRPFITLIDVVTDLLAIAPEFARVKTDETGRFAFDSLVAARYAIRASAPGREDGIAEGIVLSARAPVAEREIRLGPGATVDGRVVRPDGAPASGLRVIALLAGDGWPPPDRDFSAMTRDDGRYEIRGLPLSRMSVIVPTPEGAITLSRQVFPPVSGLDFVLEPPAFVTGVVRDRETEQPIAGAQVFGITQDLSVSIARADGEGRFSLALARGDGDATLVASAAGYADRSESLGPLSGAGPFECPISLERGVELRGTVVRADNGSPVPDVRVVASAGGIGDGALSRAETEKTGGFSFTVAPGRIRLLVEETRGLTQDPRQTPLEVKVDAEGPAEPVTISLVEAGQVCVRVTLASGGPAVGSRVDILGLGQTTGNDRGPFETDVTGTVTLSTVASGAVITAVAETRDEALGISDATTVNASGGTEIIVSTGPAYRVRGRIVDSATGSGLGGAVVTFDPRQIANRPDLASERSFLSTRTRRATTSEEGRFELTGCLPGSGDLAVVAPGFPFFRTSNVATTNDDREVDYPLPRGTEVQGRVLDATDSPLPGAWVSFERSDAPPLVLRTADDGSFATKAAPPIPFTLRASLPGHREHTLRVQSEITVKSELIIRLSKLRE